MEKVITKQHQVYNAVVASPGKKVADYARYTGVPLSSTGKILAKAELAGLLKKVMAGSTGYWNVAKPWSQEEYDEASKLLEESWHSSNKNRGSKKSGGEQPVISVTVKEANVEGLVKALQGPMLVGSTEGAVAKAMAKRSSIEGLMSESGKMELPFDITSLTLAQAHYVYRELGKLFK